MPRLGPTNLFPALIERHIDANGTPGPATVSHLGDETIVRRRVRWTLPMTQQDLVMLAKTQARLDRVRAGRPYYTALRLLSSAERSYAAREAEAAVVQASSAIESMVVETVRSMAAELATPAPKPKTPLRQLMRQYLLPWLGLTEQDPAVARWLVSGNDLRHRVVHEGAAVTLSEAKAALEAAGAFSTRIDDALVANVDRMPRTSARKLGQALLERLQDNPALRAIVEEENVSPLLVAIVPKDLDEAEGT